MCAICCFSTHSPNRGQERIGFVEQWRPSITPRHLQLGGIARKLNPARPPPHQPTSLGHSPSREYHAGVPLQNCVIKILLIPGLVLPVTEFYKKAKQDREANELLSRNQYFATGYVEDSFFTGLDILSIFTTPKLSGGLQSNFKVSSERKTSLKSCREKCVMVIHNHPLNVFYRELVSEQQGAEGKLPQFKILEKKLTKWQWNGD